MENNQEALVFDEYGRSFVLLRETAPRPRLSGPEALRTHILAARGVADILRTSLGPKGMDKLLVTPNGEVVITNDGATILQLLDTDNEVAKLMVDLARTQDYQVGDGTTGVVVLAGALLERAQDLLDKGIHPTRIADGYGMAVKCAVEHIRKISFTVTVNAVNTFWLEKVAMTALGSKIASKCHGHLARIAVEAVAAICDLDQPDPEILVNSIILRGKSGGLIEDTKLIKGVIIPSNFAHPQMSKSFENARIAVFSSSSLQLPMVNTKHQLNVGSLECFKDIDDFINNWCIKVVRVITDVGADVIVCSGNIEDSVVHLLLQNGISAIESVKDVEKIANSVGARVVSKVEDLTQDKLGTADKVNVIDFGTTNSKFISIEQLAKTKVVTIFVRGDNEVVVEEVKRSFQDAICVVRNLVKDKTAVYGGGSVEISCSLALQQESLNIPNIDQLVYQAFAEALDAIPIALAQNAGLYPLEVLTTLKANHRPELGVDCGPAGVKGWDMRAQGVLEGMTAKVHQLVLAAQLARMVLRIDDVRGPNDTIKE